MTRARGQATVELALGVLVLTPLLLFGLYLLEAANEKLVVTSAATEALWDATAYSHHSYPAGSFHTPSATAAAQAGVQARFQPRSRLFLAERSMAITCSGAGQGPAFSVASTSSFYQDLGGARCGATLTVEAQGLPSAFLDQGTGGFFQESANRLRRSFQFCETDRCQGFTMLMDDWGLTADNGEALECPLAIDNQPCQNQGYFKAARAVYEQHRTPGGTRAIDDYVFVREIVRQIPEKLLQTKDFQMSFRGEESEFKQKVPVSEGMDTWATTPNAGASASSYAVRQDDFLGR